MMVLRVKCKCGRPLKIAAQHAGKKLACPGCKKPFRIPAEKFEAAARSAGGASAAKAKAMPTRAVAPTPDPMPAELDLVAEIAESQSGVLFALAGDADTATSQAAAPLPAVIVEGPDATDMGYAGDPTKRSTRRTKLDNDAPAAKRGFWENVVRAFAYPFMSGGNIITFMIIGVLAIIQYGLNSAGILGSVGQGIIFGWFCALYFSIIQDTAAGSEDLPGIRMENGFMDDIIKPAFFFMGAFAISLLPALALLLLWAFDVVPDSALPTFPIWIAAGIFVVPMVLILFAFDAANMILKPHLIVASIAKSLLPYLAIWLMLMLVISMKVAVAFGEVYAKIGLGMFPDFTKQGLAASMISAILNMYLSIVAMRIIGLYYLHFKRRFVFEME